MNSRVFELARLLKDSRHRIATFSVVAGFDGFVDEMISVVAERRGVEQWIALGSMAELGKIVSAAAGHNSLREIVVRSQDAGGCAVNLSDGLTALGVQLDYFGTLGQPRHPSFDAFALTCRSCTPWSKAYGRTLAFEFQDGKFMFSAVAQLSEFDAALVRSELARGDYQRACASASLIAITNWTLYPHMTACWRLLAAEVFAKLAPRRRLFLDLVDPSSRAEGDVRDMLVAMGEFQRVCDVTLGINVNEAGVLSRILNLLMLEPSPDGLTRCAEALRVTLGIDQVVIHSARINAVASAAGPRSRDWPPKRPTCFIKS